MWHISELNRDALLFMKTAIAKYFLLLDSYKYVPTERDYLEFQLEMEETYLSNTI